METMVTLIDRRAAYNKGFAIVGQNCKVQR